MHIRAVLQAKGRIKSPNKKHREADQTGYLLRGGGGGVTASVQVWAEGVKQWYKSMNGTAWGGAECKSLDGEVMSSPVEAGSEQPTRGEEGGGGEDPHQARQTASQIYNSLLVLFVAFRVFLSSFIRKCFIGGRMLVLGWGGGLELIGSFCCVCAETNVFF